MLLPALQTVGAVLGFIPPGQELWVLWPRCCFSSWRCLVGAHSPSPNKGKTSAGHPSVSSLLCAPSILAEFGCRDPLGSACSSGSTLRVVRGCSNVELCSFFPVIRGAAVCGGQTKFNAAFWSVNSRCGHQEHDKLHPNSAQRCSVPNRGFTASEP